MEKAQTEDAIRGCNTIYKATSEATQTSIHTVEVQAKGRPGYGQYGMSAKKKY